MQLSQLDKESLTLVMLLVRSLVSKAACRLLAMMPPTPPRTLRAIATSMEGMLAPHEQVWRPRSGWSVWMQDAVCVEKGTEAVGGSQSTTTPSRSLLCHGSSRWRENKRKWCPSRSGPAAAAEKGFLERAALDKRRSKGRILRTSHFRGQRKRPCLGGEEADARLDRGRGVRQGSLYAVSAVESTGRLVIIAW